MENKLINSATVRALCGGISDMSLWRWLHNPEMAFPKPRVIARRRYWIEAEILAWIDAQAEKGAA
ncbi:helix-turn-helix transcriptional regulator [Sinirhodobacter huangdaonensis]|uniref:Transcriptional regulator n=1 Tax=Paenirhodobacter huangdaonensis TaxID=2501515 RepID=A0A443LW03_9RHOB|nr:transcriptional regulator [Sinirhodobacter huangdaonensis]RWR53335.1 transcriptional regulator [Sinirhodobacter huangdaonensis]